MQFDRVDIDGAVVFWKLDTMSRATVIDGLRQEGFTKLPEERKALSCLKAALGELYPSDSTTRRAIRPIENGYAVIVEPNSDTVDPGDNWGHVQATATLDDNDSLTTTDFAKVSEIRDAMSAAADVFSSAAAGRLLSQLITDELSGVCLREAGGVYWVRADQFDRWRNIARIFQQGDSKVYTLHVAADEHSVRAVGDHLTDEVLRELATIEAEISAGDLGERALRTRRAMIDRLERKVKDYEAAFKKPLDELVAACDRAATAATLQTIQEGASAVQQGLSLQVA